MCIPHRHGDRFVPQPRLQLRECHAPLQQPCGARVAAGVWYKLFVQL